MSSTADDVTKAITARYNAIVIAANIVNASRNVDPTSLEYLDYTSKYIEACANVTKCDAAIKAHYRCNSKAFNPQ